MCKRLIVQLITHRYFIEIEFGLSHNTDYNSFIVLSRNINQLKL